MKKIIFILIIIFIVLISGCSKGKVKAGGLTASLQIFPDERIIKSDSNIKVSVNLISKETQDLNGKLCIYDSPDYEQFGGIPDAACENFNIPKVQEKGDSKEITIQPEGADLISYKPDTSLTDVSFTAQIRYRKEELAKSNSFCMVNQEDQNCNLEQRNIGFPDSYVVRSLDKSLFDTDSDKIIDFMMLEIELQEDQNCNLIHPDLVENFDLDKNSEEYKGKEIYFEIELEQAKIRFTSDGDECSFTKESTKNRKVIICETNLNIRENFYDNEVLNTKFIYGCELPLLTKNIEFNKEE